MKKFRLEIKSSFLALRAVSSGATFQLEQPIEKPLTITLRKVDVLGRKHCVLWLLQTVKDWAL